jgi:outer membrane protein assembly factor BamB
LPIKSRQFSGRAIVAFSAVLLLAVAATAQVGPELPTIWEQEIDSRWESGPFCLPAIGEDRSVYVGSADGTLHAFSGGGLRSWHYDTTKNRTKRLPENGIMGIAIDVSGTIYAASNGLLAFTKNGELKWQLWSEAEQLKRTSAPALGAGGRVYVLHDHSLYALSPEGKIEWNREIHAPRWEFSPVIGRNGAVYVAGYNYAPKHEPSSLLYSFRPDGELEWTFETHYLAHPPALDNEGNIYFTEHRGLLAVDENGRLKWIYDTQGLLSSSTPAISSDHVIYFGLDHWLFAVDHDGKFRWRFETAGKVQSPAIDAAENVWFASNDRHLYCVSQKGILVGKWLFEGMIGATPLIGKHGLIFLRDARSLRVLRGPNGPAACPWPMQRHDVENTGRLGFN